MHLGKQQLKMQKKLHEYHMIEQMCTFILRLKFD